MEKTSIGRGMQEFLEHMRKEPQVALRSRLESWEFTLEILLACPHRQDSTEKTVSENENSIIGFPGAD